MLDCPRCGSPLKPDCPHVGNLCCACADMENRRLFALLDEVEDRDG